MNIEILVRDDFSTDNTTKILRDLKLKYSFISLIPAKLPSGSAARNFYNLILEANIKSFDYVSFCDQDDIWFSNKLSRSTNKLNILKYDGYSSSVLAFWTNNRRKLITQSKYINKSDFLFEGAGQGCTFLLPAHNFKKIQEFCLKHRIIINNFHYHDWLIYILIRAWNGNWFFDSEPTIYYRQHLYNDTGSRGSFLATIKRFQKIRNGWYKSQIAIALKIYFLAANHKNNLILSFSKIFNEKDSIKRRFLVTKFLWLHGRRRLSDRVVLVLASLLGYI